VTDPTILQWAPLATAVVWFGLCVYQVARDRFQTWTEVFLLATLFCVGMYALAEFLFLQAANAAIAGAAVRDGLSCLTLAATFLLLFGVVFHSRMRRRFLLAFVPSAAALVGLWSVVVLGLQSGSGDVPYSVAFREPWLALWLGWIVIYAALGLGYLYRAYAEGLRTLPGLSRRVRFLLIALSLVTALGLGTDGLTALLSLPVPPLFPSLLIAPGLLLGYALSPAGEAGLQIAIQRWKAGEYDIRGAFVCNLDGLLLGSEVFPGEDAIDGDLFAAALDTIQNFLRTSFAMLQGKWLRSIRQGDHTLVIERGRRTYLILILRGPEDDQLRRRMRDLLRKYEDANADALAPWSGMPSDIVGTNELLSAFLE
jgi:hypothetical protein